MDKIYVALCCIVTASICVQCAPVKAGQYFGSTEPQIHIARVDLMPNLPSPLKIRDWSRTTRDYDRIAFDLDAKGQYLPLVWLDNSHTNYPVMSFGLPAYVGETSRHGGAQAISTLSAVLGATLVGIDKSKGKNNWALMTEQWFNKANGQNMVLNNYSAGTGGSFWYELWPNILFDGIASCYPNLPNASDIMKSSADQWCGVANALTDAAGVADFDHTSFDVKAMKPVDNGKWKEPDGAAGVSYLEYVAYERYGDQKYLTAADACERFLQAHQKDPLYEVIEPWGAYTAARMNAEAGRDYDVAKEVNWAFGPSDARPGWGAIVGNWGGCDCDGLVGSVTDCDGYAFTMNTFAMSGALVPLVRYDQRFARAVGKWMLNAANAARLFYPDELPADHQSCPGWQGDNRHAVAYEGLRNKLVYNGTSYPTPYASGDPIRYKWGPPTDFGIYGSSHVGFFGGIVAKTNDPAILQLDCLKTDFFHKPAYPTYLYYNPHPHAAGVTVDVGKKPIDLYSLTSHRFVRTRVRGSVSVSLAGDDADVLVLVPSNAKVKLERGRLMASEVTVDFRAGR